jgi:zinc/manganese transport system substrate-binding protein
VVAAENVYGDLAQQIGGSNVTITSILANPNPD